jgi:hypothetical protein
MSLKIADLTWEGLLLTVSGSILFAELAGYGLHRLMHSEKLPALSRAHMIHHLHLYGPCQPMRASTYKDATEGRIALGNMGLEWLVPLAAILGACWIVLWSFAVPRLYEALALVIMLAWPLLMFSYLHDRMHLENFWMERTPLLKIWFVRARRLHDIHHHSLDNNGRMDRNFGIGFFLFDRAFRTITHRHCPLNWHGYRNAMDRYRLEKEYEDEFADFPSRYRV